MAVPPSTSLAWAWALEFLSEVKEVDPKTLYDLLSAVPDLEATLKASKFAEERLALRFLEEGIAANPISDSREPSEINLPLESVSDIDATEVLEKVAASGSLLKCGSELKEAVSQFIIKKKATLPKCAIQKLQDSDTEECNGSSPSMKEIFVEDSSHKIDTAQELKCNDENDEIQPLQQSSASVIHKIGNEDLQKHPHAWPADGATETTCEVQTPHKSVDKANDASVEASQEVHNQCISAGDAQDDVVDTTCQDFIQNVCVEKTHVQNLDKVMDDDAKCVMVPETSISSDREHHMISNEERSEKVYCDSWTIDGTSDNYCVKCEKRGELLICSNSSCLLAVHESCLASSIIFEDDGSFYCPFCTYTRAHAAYRKAKLKLSEAWRAVTAFKDGYPLDQKKQKCPIAEFPSRHVEVENMGNSSPSKVMEASPISKKHGYGRGKDAKEHDASDALLPSMANVDAGNQISMKLSSKRGITHQRPSKRYANSLFPYARRTKLQWTAEEEFALKEGVKRYSGSWENIPWTIILEEGHHIFHKTRTPVDLKDKWRNIRKRSTAELN